jgi:hypothetical protein
MKPFFVVIFLFVSKMIQAQTPTDYPPVRTKEVPEQLQDPLTMFLIILGSLAVVVLILYFFRFDKYIAKWFRPK